MNEVSERALFEHIGGEALAYLLAVEVNTLQLRLEDSTAHRLSDTQEQVLIQLVTIDQQMQAWQEDSETSSEWAGRLSGLSDPVPSMSLANVARQISGGEIYKPSSRTKLEELILKLAIDSYPGRLVKESEEPWGSFGSMRGMFSNPSNKLFQETAMKDKVLSSLFPNNDSSGGPSGSLLRSVGLGGSIQLSTLAESILESSWAVASLATKTPSAKQYTQSVLLSLKTLRAAIKGNRASVPARMGLTGLLFPDGVHEMDLGWGKVRRADDRDDKYARRSGLTGQLTGTNESGQTAVINYQGDLILEIDAPYAVAIRGIEVTDPWPEALLVSSRALETAVENLRLGLLLAFPQRRVILHPSWQTQIDPLSRGMSMGWNDVTHAIGLMPTQLNVDEVEDWKTWATRIGAHRIPTIAVAIRRMLASLADRRTMEDILVDAVIVWENLFGAKTETTLRVSSSLAWLLGRSSQDRRERQARYKKIYEFRSRVVHGTPNVDQSELQAFALEAVQISIDALRCIFEHHPDLLEIKTSELRSLEIMHRGDSPAN